MRSVVGRVVDDGVVGNLQLVEQVEQLPHMHVVLDHAGRVFVHMPTRMFVCLLAHLGFDMRAEVHACAVPPDVEGLTLLMGTA